MLNFVQRVPVDKVIGSVSVCEKYRYAFQDVDRLDRVAPTCGVNLLIGKLDFDISEAPVGDADRAFRGDSLGAGHHVDRSKPQSCPT